MAEEKEITHEAFVEQLQSGRMKVALSENKLNDFVNVYLPVKKLVIYRNLTSNFQARTQYYAIKWLGIFFVTIVPLALLFVNWIFALVTFGIGLRLVWATKKLAEDFVIERLIYDEAFWNDVVLNHGVEIRDEEGNKYSPTRLL